MCDAERESRPGVRMCTIDVELECSDGRKRASPPHLTYLDYSETAEVWMCICFCFWLTEWGDAHNSALFVNRHRKDKEKGGKGRDTPFEKERKSNSLGEWCQEPHWHKQDNATVHRQSLIHL